MKAWPPSKNRKLAPAIRTASPCCVSGNAIPSKRPAAINTGQRICCSRSHVSSPARRQLASQAHLAPRLTREGIRRDERHEPRIVLRISRRPRRAESRVRNREHVTRALFALEMLDLVERIGGAAGAARRGTCEHQLLHFRGMS